MHVFPAWGLEQAAWSILGVGPDAEGPALDEAFEREKSLRLAGGSITPLGVLRQAWKALRDPFYAGLARSGASWEELASAGLFDDQMEPRQWRALFADVAPAPSCAATHTAATRAFGPFPPPKLGMEELSGSFLQAGESPPGGAPARWSTPWGHLDLELAATSEQPVILLTTGSFAPFHEGHWGMLEAARAACLAHGWTPIGGFVSPSHESYTGAKDDGRAAWGGAERVESVGRFLARDAFWAVDPWEALSVDVSINFTDVLRRLGLYLRRINPIFSRAKIVMVFGGDNAGFARAFETRGAAVGVERKPEDHKARDTVLAAQAKNPDVLWAIPSREHQSASSTALRRATADWRAMAMAPFSPVYQRGRGEARAAVPAAPPNGFLGEQVLRDEGDRLWADWALDPLDAQEQARWRRAWSQFKQAIVLALEEAWSGHPHKPSFVIDCVQTQAAWARRAGRGRRWLCLDESVSTQSGLFRWDGSREFQIASRQARAGQWGPRPGFPAFSEQIARLREQGAGPWVALDDDVSTGGTLRALAAALPLDMPLRGTLTLTGMSGRRRHQGKGWWLYDVMDLRDWLLGAPSGGLVVRLPSGRLGRAPYLSPWVNLISRAGLPAASAQTFCARVAAANKVFFQTAPRPVTVADLEEPSRRFWSEMGWADETELCAISHWAAAAFPR